MSQPCEPCTSTPCRPAALTFARRPREVGHDLGDLVAAERQRALAARHADADGARAGPQPSRPPVLAAVAPPATSCAKKPGGVGVERFANLRETSTCRSSWAEIDVGNRCR